jgi:hypothetical protein
MYLNLLNVIVWDGKIPGNCVDSMAISKFSFAGKSYLTANA